MYVQIITYKVDGVSEPDLQGAAGPIAPLIAASPGLISKTWLADPETNTYGGVYLWESRAAAESPGSTNDSERRCALMDARAPSTRPRPNPRATPPSQDMVTLTAVDNFGATETVHFLQHDLLPLSSPARLTFTCAATVYPTGRTCILV